MSRLAAALWLEHRSAVETIVTAAKERGIEIRPIVPELVVDAPLQPPWITVIRGGQRFGFHDLMNELGWRSRANARGWLLLGGAVRYERRGVVVWIGGPARIRGRGVAWRSRLALPLYALVNRVTPKRNYMMSFAGLSLWVPVGVFRPHPSTEGLIKAIAEACVQPPRSIIDVGTGAGGIALALARTWPRARVTGIDRSARAISSARINAKRGQCRNARFQLGDLLDDVERQSADVIAGNLAWLAPAVYVAFGGAERPYRGPPSALLDEHADGMGYFRRLIPQAAQVLRAGGWIFLQLSPLQLNATRQMLMDAGFIVRLAGVDLIGAQLPT
jgi:methylase of polypeptide subunit release factors